MTHPTGFEPVEVPFLAKLCQAMPIKSISYVGSVWHTLFKGAQTGAQLLFFLIDLSVVFNDGFELAEVAFKIRHLSDVHLKTRLTNDKWGRFSPMMRHSPGISLKPLYES